jgi:hypothetical protein
MCSGVVLRYLLVFFLVAGSFQASDDGTTVKVAVSNIGNVQRISAKYAGTEVPTKVEAPSLAGTDLVIVFDCAFLGFSLDKLHSQAKELITVLSDPRFHVRTVFLVGNPAQSGGIFVVHPVNGINVWRYQRQVSLAAAMLSAPNGLFSKSRSFLYSDPVFLAHYLTKKAQRTGDLVRVVWVGSLRWFYPGYRDADDYSLRFSRFSSEATASLRFSLLKPSELHNAGNSKDDKRYEQFQQQLTGNRIRSFNSMLPVGENLRTLVEGSTDGLIISATIPSESKRSGSLSVTVEGERGQHHVEHRLPSRKRSMYRPSEVDAQLNILAMPNGLLKQTQGCLATPGLYIEIPDKPLNNSMIAEALEEQGGHLIVRRRIKVTYEKDGICLLGIGDDQPEKFDLLLVQPEVPRAWWLTCHGSFCE